MHGFDVEDWVVQHRANPAAFDAARQTVIALELARARPEHTGPARRLLERLRADAEGVGQAQRLRRSALYMTAALAQMARALEELEDSGANSDSISRRSR
jgi:hypothetical protein